MFKKKDLLRFVILFIMFFMFLAPIRANATQFVDVGKLNENGAFDFSTNTTDDMKFGKIQQSENFWDLIYTRYRGVIMMISGAISLFFIGVFIINITRYGTSASNPQTRKQAMITLLWTGIASAIFGGVTLWVGLFYNLVK